MHGPLRALAVLALVAAAAAAGYGTTAQRNVRVLQQLPAQDAQVMAQVLAVLEQTVPPTTLELRVPDAYGSHYGGAVPYTVVAAPPAAVAHVLRSHTEAGGLRPSQQLLSTLRTMVPGSQSAYSSAYAGFHGSGSAAYTGAHATAHAYAGSAHAHAHAGAGAHYYYDPFSGRQVDFSGRASHHQQQYYDPVTGHALQYTDGLAAQLSYKMVDAFRKQRDYFYDPMTGAQKHTRGVAYDPITGTKVSGGQQWFATHAFSDPAYEAYNRFSGGGHYAAARPQHFYDPLTGRTLEFSSGRQYYDPLTGQTLHYASDLGAQLSYKMLDAFRHGQAHYYDPLTGSQKSTGGVAYDPVTGARVSNGLGYFSRHSYDTSAYAGYQKYASAKAAKSSSQQLSGYGKAGQLGHYSAKSSSYVTPGKAAKAPTYDDYYGERAREEGYSAKDGVNRDVVHQANVELIAGADTPHAYRHILVRMLARMSSVAGRPVLHYESLQGRRLRYSVIAGDHTRAVSALRHLEAELGVTVAAHEITMPSLTAAQLQKERLDAAEAYHKGSDVATAKSHAKALARQKQGSARAYDEADRYTSTGKNKAAQGATGKQYHGYNTAAVKDSELDDFFNSLAGVYDPEGTKAAVKQKPRTEEITDDELARQNERQLARLAPSAREAVVALLQVLDKLRIALRLHDAALDGHAVMYTVARGDASHAQYVGNALGVAVSDDTIRVPHDDAKGDAKGVDEDVGEHADGNRLPTNAGNQHAHGDDVSHSDLMAALNDLRNPQREEDDAADMGNSNNNNEVLALTHQEAAQLGSANRAELSRLDSSAAAAIRDAVFAMAREGTFLRVTADADGGKMVSYTVVRGDHSRVLGVAERHHVTATSTTLEAGGAVTATALDVSELERRENEGDNLNGVVTAEAVDEQGNPIVGPKDGADGVLKCGAWFGSNDCAEGKAEKTGADDVRCHEDAVCAVMCCADVELDEDAVIAAHRAKLEAAAAGLGAGNNAAYSHGKRVSANTHHFDGRSHLLGHTY